MRGPEGERHHVGHTHDDYRIGKIDETLAENREGGFVERAENIAKRPEFKPLNWSPEQIEALRNTNISQLHIDELIDSRLFQDKKDLEPIIVAANMHHYQTQLN